MMLISSEKSPDRKLATPLVQGGFKFFDPLNKEVAAPIIASREIGTTNQIGGTQRGISEGKLTLAGSPLRTVNSLP
jgi:hypothetical protein